MIEHRPKLFSFAIILCLAVGLAPALLTTNVFWEGVTFPREEGQLQLSREEGAIEITPELIALGREAFYLETFGNEIFLTDVVGVLDGPVNLWSVARAVLALRGGYTTNLQIPIDEEITVGGRTFPAGSVLNTGMDVAAGPDALRAEEDRYVVADAAQLGMTGTLMRQIRPDPASSLRVLIDRTLRELMIEASRAHPDLQQTGIEGFGHEFWVDEEAGFSVQEQTDLILFLLSLDDPAVLPPTEE